MLESEWSPNRDTVIPYGITVKTRFGTKPHCYIFRINAFIFSFVIIQKCISCLSIGGMEARYYCMNKVVQEVYNKIGPGSHLMCVSICKNNYYSTFPDYSIGINITIII